MTGDYELDLTMTIRVLVERCRAQCLTEHRQPREVAIELLADVDMSVLRRMAESYLTREAASAERYYTQQAERKVLHQAASRSSLRPSQIRPKKGTAAYTQWAASDEGRHYLEEDAQLRRQVDAQARTEVERLVGEYVVRQQIVWTEGLRHSVLGLPGGTSSVTWGQATVEQHRAKLQQHATHTYAGFAGMAVHIQAIADIEARGVTCLDDLYANRKAG